MGDMNIYAKNGDKVRFANPNNGYTSDQEIARFYLTVGNIYTVDVCDVSSSSTTVFLKQFPGVGFNSVMFDEVVENKIKYYVCVMDMKSIKISKEAYLETASSVVSWVGENLPDSFGYELRIFSVGEN